MFKKNNMRNGMIEIKLGNIRIKNTELNLTVIEIEDNKRIGIHFLELDDRLYKKEHECYFKNDSLYIIQCSNINNILVSSGVISDICNNNTFKYLGCNNPKGSIIFNTFNNKIIGINGENKSTFNNIGLFFKPIIEGFKIKYRHLTTNEINLVVKAEKDDINNKIYFLSNNEINNNLKEINEKNTEVYINNKKENICKKYFIPEKEEEYKIKLKINNIITDCSYMFAGCNKIIDINFSSVNITNVNNMSYMFYNCENLKNVKFFSFINKNIINMEYMFYNCKSLNDLDLSFLNFKMLII